MNHHLGAINGNTDCDHRRTLLADVADVFITSLDDEPARAYVYPTSDEGLTVAGLQRLAAAATEAATILAAEPPTLVRSHLRLA